MSVLSNDFCRRCIYVGAFPEVKKNRLQFVQPQPCNSECPNFKGKVNSEKHLGMKYQKETAICCHKPELWELFAPT